MNRLALAVVLISTVAGLGLATQDLTHVKTQKLSFHANATVVNQTGNSTKDIGIVANREFRFGSLPTSSSSIKFFKLDAPRKSIVLISSTGNISRYLKHETLLYFKGKKRVSVHFNATKPGFYNGGITVKTWVPEDRWGSKWVELRYRVYRLFY